jgi:tetratricopeptide (TPR) repeat protein
MTTTLERPDPYSIKVRPAGRRAARRSPDPRLATLREGLRFMTHERLEEARDALSALATEEALAERDGLAVDALAYLSSVTWSLGDPVAAIDMAERALELGPDRFAPNQKAAEASMRLGHVDRAEVRFLAALRASEPGTGDAKAAERCLREARKRSARGIRHGTRGIGLGRLLRLFRLHPTATRPAGDTAQPTA